MIPDEDKIVKLPILQYYNESIKEWISNNIGNVANIKYITGNSKENPFTWNDNELGVYIFDTYDIWARATNTDTNNRGAQINTYNGVLIVLAHITDNTEIDTPIGYYINNRYVPRIVVYSGQNITGRIFDIAFPDSSLNSYPLIVNPGGISGPSNIKFSSPKSNATADWYESRENNDDYLATIEWVKKYGRNNDFINLSDFKENYQENFGATMYDHDFDQIVHNIMYDNRIKAGTYITGNIYTKDTTVPNQNMDYIFYVTVKNENYQQVFIEGYIPDDPISQRYYTVMTRSSPFSVTGWQKYEWDAYATKKYVDEHSSSGSESINMKVIDKGDKTVLIDIDESFPTDGKNSYIIRGAFVSENILMLDREPVHVQRFGTQLFVTTMNGKIFTFVKNSSTGIWTQYGNEKTFVNNEDVITKTNTTSYMPTKNYHPATKKYVDDNIKNLLSFNSDGELVVTLDGVSKVFIPKENIEQLSESEIQSLV